MKIAREPAHLLMNMGKMMIEFLVDYSTDEIIEKCKNCKALAYNATPPEEKNER